MATLFSGQALQPGQSLQSDNKLHTLILQSDGNVVLYNQHSQAIWATNTGSLIDPRDFIMQTDGNLVLYDTSGRPKWASNTWNNPGAFLNVQDDGNLVVYRAGSQTETASNALWASGSNDVPVQGDGVGERILEIMNGERRGAGLPPLTLDPRLNASALVHSNTMAETGVFAHQVPGEPALGDRITAQGYRWSFIEENISAGQSTPEEVVSGWFNETPPNDGHRQNILRGDVQNVGVGYVFRDGTQYKHYWTADFGKPA